MIDIHSHILPGVDDGAQTVAEALDMLRMSADGGVTTQILTPHIQPGRFNNIKGELLQHFAVFQDQVNEANIDIELRLSAEVRIGTEVMQLVKQNAIPWLGEFEGKKTFLLEFPRQDVPFGSDNLVRWLLANNCLPIIVHPERNRTFLDQRHKLQTFIELGCPLQITACSLTGTFGEDAQKMGHELLESSEATLVASDCHNLKGRKPDLGVTMQTLDERIKTQVFNASVSLTHQKRLSN